MLICLNGVGEIHKIGLRCSLTAIRQATTRRLVVAGGITTQQEIDSLNALGMDAVVGMALYSGTISA